MTSPLAPRRLARVAALALLGLGSALPAAAAERHPAFLKAGVSVSPPPGAVGICSRYGWACQRGAVAAASGDIMGLADRVNREVNRRVRPTSDQAQYGRVEYWTLPGKRGDCEDYALEKKRVLMQAGVRGDQLLLATALDRSGGAHAVLVLRTGSGDYVLDNLTDRIKPWGQTGYTFLRMQDPAAPQQWRALFAGGIFAGNSPTAKN